MSRHHPAPSARLPDGLAADPPDGPPARHPARPAHPAHRSRARRWLAAVVVASALVALGTGLPFVLHRAASARYPVTAAALQDARAALDALPVRALASADGYSREEFGPAWADVDHNGCDTRDDVLARDLTAVTYKPGSAGCVVASGTLDDPYTGRRIAFVRGPDSADVQIDHMVALDDAWRTGAQDLTAAQREQLANDPANLLAVDGPANQDKSASDAAAWLPPNRGFRCAYVVRQVRVKAAYGLWVTADEKAAIARTLDGCVVGAS